MVRKPAKMWRRLEQPYTRKEYLSSIPQLKIHTFEMGNPQKSYDCEVWLAAQIPCQIRQEALEAARIAANRYLVSSLGGSNFHLKVRVYPYHILREHKMAVGAGADRISQGMSLAFGRPIGYAAQVKRGQKLLSVRVAFKDLNAAKQALKRASHKLPGISKIGWRTIPS